MSQTNARFRQTHIATQLIINSILLCLGRTPVQPPTRINPEIGKLPKETVARIPLVLYIPHPGRSWRPRSQDVETHSYPPKNNTPSHNLEQPSTASVLRLSKSIPFKAL